MHGHFTITLSAVLLICVLCNRVDSGRLPLWRSVQPHCRQETWKYVPSQLESAWMAKVGTWNSDTTEEEFCEFAQQFEQNSSYWLDANSRLMKTDRSSLPEPEGDAVFSAFVTTLLCSGGTSTTHTSWIEPLAFALRHPTAGCGSGAKMLNRGYLLLASAQDYRPQYDGSRSVSSHSRRKAFLFDLGASLWASGSGGSSQSYLVSAYRERGIRFDRILMWEAKPHTPAEIFQDVPREYHAAYQYMNIPASKEVNDPGNPLNILKALATPDDFVAFKLDIDNSLIENSLMDQIFSDPEVHTRIDEFFFEHHVNFKQFVRAWGPAHDPSKTLADSYNLFTELRKLGIRSHGWP